MHPISPALMCSLVDSLTEERTKVFTHEGLVLSDLIGQEQREANLEVQDRGSLMSRLMGRLHLGTAERPAEPSAT